MLAEQVVGIVDFEGTVADCAVDIVAADDDTVPEAENTVDHPLDTPVVVPGRLNFVLDPY